MANNFWEKTKTFLGFSPEEEISEEIEEKITPPRSTHRPIVGLSSQKQIEIVVYEPRIYEDSISIATHLREGKLVILNLKYLDTEAGKRLIDFVCGTTYAIDGHMLKIGESIFLFTPEHVLITDANEKSTLEKGIEAAERQAFFKGH